MLNTKTDRIVPILPAVLPAVQAYLDAAVTGLGFLDDSYRLHNTNVVFRKMIGPHTMPLAGQNLFSVLRLKDKNRALAISELETGKPWRGLIRINDRALKIEIRPVQADLPGNSDNGAAQGYAVSLIDYSRDLKHLHKLAAAKNQAEKTDKAKSQFLSHMSHELRTPLNAILGFTQLLKISSELSELQQDNLGEIEAAGNYLLALINEILDLSSIEAGKLRLTHEQVDLGTLVDECMMLTEPMARGRNIKVGQRVDVQGILLTDHVRLKQIILNLLSNAIKYNSKSGTVCLSIYHTGSGTVRFEVQDSGPGIEASKLTSIFSPFERLGADNTAVEGTGIGLMITRRLVNLMHGEIGVFSVPGSGSVFWVELPQEKNPLLEEVLGSTPEFHQISVDEIRKQLIWIGAGTPPFNALEQLPRLRPYLDISRFEDVSQAGALLDEQLAPALIFTSADDLQHWDTDLVTKTLKVHGITVVMERGAGTMPETGLPDENLSVIHSQIRMTELLCLVDSFLNPI